MNQNTVYIKRFATFCCFTNSYYQKYNLFTNFSLCDIKNSSKKHLEFSSASSIMTMKYRKSETVLLVFAEKKKQDFTGWKPFSDHSRLSDWLQSETRQYNPQRLVTQVKSWAMVGWSQMLYLKSRKNASFCSFLQQYG